MTQPLSSSSSRTHGPHCNCGCHDWERLRRKNHERSVAALELIGTVRLALDLGDAQAARVAIRDYDEEHR